jgi:hypothetical protein
MQKIDAIGIDPTPPSAAYEEMLYIHRNVYANNHHTNPIYESIWTSNMPDEEKLAQMKVWAEAQYKIKFDKLAAYNPEGKTMTGFGDGFRYWERWDIPRAKIEQEMQNYTLIHSLSGGDTEKTLRGMLQSGGEATPTVQRLRKGVNVSSTGGQSYTSDMNTGGASYFFTRIHDKSSSAALQFKIGNLARQDAVSYSQDNYGAISKFAERKSDIAGWKRAAASSGNETIFKHGLSLLDDLERITVHTIAERNSIIKMFKENKVTHLNDGRKIEDVVFVR